MVTAEEEAPLVCLSRLKLRRDPDTRSGLRFPAATDKGDLEINVSVAAVPIVLQLRTDRRRATRRIHPRKDTPSTFLESCICFHFSPQRSGE